MLKKLIYKCGGIVIGICILIAFILSVLSLTGTVEKTLPRNKYTIPMTISPLGILADLTFFAILILIIRAYLKHRKNRNPQITLTATLNLKRVELIVFCAISVIWLALGFVYIVISKIYPNYDQEWVMQFAYSFATDSIDRLGLMNSEYMNVYSFQTGISLFYELVYRVTGVTQNTGLSTYIKIAQLVNLPMAVITLFSMRRIIRRIFNNDIVSILYLMLMFSFLPYFLYFTFIYAEIPSFTFAAFGIMMLVEGCNNIHIKGWLFITLGVVSLSTAVCLRPSYLILIIAVCMALLLNFLLNKDIRVLLIIPLVCVCVFLTINIPKTIYENRTGITLKEGAPFVGLVYSGLINEGGWSPVPYEIYAETNFDREKTANILERELKEAVIDLATNPIYAASFFFKKLRLAWADPNLGCFVLMHPELHYQEIPEWLNSVLHGRIYVLITFLMERLQFLYYSCFLISMILLLKSKKKQQSGSYFADYVLPIYIVGGFIYSMLFEVSPRYQLCYFLFMLLFSAHGLAAILTFRNSNGKNITKTHIIG